MSEGPAYLSWACHDSRMTDHQDKTIQVNQVSPQKETRIVSVSFQFCFQLPYCLPDATTSEA